MPKGIEMALKNIVQSNRMSTSEAKTGEEEKAKTNSFKVCYVLN